MPPEAPAADVPFEEPPEVPVQANASDDLSDAPTCVFCDRPAGNAEYAWPEWLARFLMDRHMDQDATLREPGLDLVVLERVETEIDKTVTCVCETCTNGWMQRLEENASPLLRSMIVGDPTPLPPARRKLLARWSAKTAIVMECASRTWIRTPRFASEHLRKVGVHPGTQVLVGHYDGHLQLLTNERDLFSRMVDGEKRYIGQTTFVIGKLIVQVFADPWRDSAPELTEGASHPFVPLLGGNGRVIEWPPAVSVDDTLYDLARCGPISEDVLPPRKTGES
jgi:hypothetical protein